MRKLNNCDDVILWKRNNEKLLNKMNEWRENYFCRNDCEEWKKWEFCNHLRKARAEKFSKEMDEQIKRLITINNFH